MVAQHYQYLSFVRAFPLCLRFFWKVIICWGLIYFYSCNHPGHLLQLRIYVFFFLLWREVKDTLCSQWSLQSFLSSIRVADINRLPLPITPSLNCRWHVQRSKWASNHCHLRLCCKHKRPTVAEKYLKLSFRTRTLYSRSPSDGSQSFVLKYLKHFLKVLTEQGGSQNARFCHVKWIKELRHGQTISENIKEPIGLVRRASGHPDVSGVCVKVAP